MTDINSSHLLYESCSEEPNLEKIKSLINHDADVNYSEKSWFSSNGLTPLTCAVKGNNLELVKLLLNKDAAIYHKDSYDRYPFQYALINELNAKGQDPKSREILELLFEKNKKIDVIFQMFASELLKGSEGNDIRRALGESFTTHVQKKMESIIDQFAQKTENIFIYEEFIKVTEQCAYKSGWLSGDLTNYSPFCNSLRDNTSALVEAHTVDAICHFYDGSALETHPMVQYYDEKIEQHVKLVQPDVQNNTAIC